MVELNQLSVHVVGNKNRYEHLVKSKLPLELNDEMREVMLDFFQKAFKGDEYFNFYHSSDLNMNECYTYISAIFKNSEELHEQSINLATWLFDNSTHPQIKAGELFTAYFKNVNYKGEVVDAIGLFKTENKDVFLKVKHEDHFFDVELDKGININKLDKGCLIYNVQKENGYEMLITDKTNGNEAAYWADEFLQVTQVQNAFYNTEKTMAVFKNYVEERLPEDFEVSRIDQADMLNRTMEFFSSQEKFVADEFTEKVLQQPELIESFNNYKSDYEYESQQMLSDDFGIEEKAVKKQKKYFKSVLKLDKNFHIYIHGDRSKIENGEDAKGKFYKVYYEEEN